MIHVLSESQGQVLGIKATGKLTDQDYKEVLIPKLERVIREHGKARLLCDLGEEFHGWELHAMWDDAKFGFLHRNDFEKVAVLGGPKWIDWAVKISKLLISAEVKTFTPDQWQDAWTWVKT